MSKINEGLSKIEIKNLSPMIAMISSGKTSILKVLYDVDFLEVSAGIGTKFVNIIRYNPKVGKEPKFYHLIVKKGQNGKYEYFKDPNFKEVIGSEDIKKKNMELNEQYKSKQNVPYEDLFYMVEVGHSNLIGDEEYLKNYDLVDIPGVSEYKGNENDKEEAPAAGESKKGEKKTKTIYDSIEKSMLSYDPKSEKTYLTEFFKIMKDNINSGIIVFSVDNFQLAENYEIIGKLQKVLNKPIENYLVLLNKIDRSDNIEKDIGILEGKIAKYFPSANLFNFTKNLIVPVSAYQLENESKLQNSFHYFLNYHFLNFLMSSKKDTPGTTTDGFSFIDFLKKINPIKNLTKKKYDDILNQVLGDEKLEEILSEIKSVIDFIIKNNKSNNNLNLGVRPDEFEKEKIKELKENIDEDDGEEQDEEDKNEIFNINEQDEKGIIIYYYSLFKNKNKEVFPEKSEEYLKIVNYFTMKNFEKHKDNDMKKFEEEYEKFLKELRNKNNKINNLSLRMAEFYKKLLKENTRKINIKLLNNYINNSISILKASQYFYIPLLGVSNAGKSTILDTLIGYKLLPAHKNECTKKGILIKHWNRPIPVLRKTNLEKKESLNKEIYYQFEPNKGEIASGVEQIQRYLEASNYEFCKDEKDFFFEIDVNIKFIEELNLDEDLKDKICFIDLPGFGTNNEFEENDVYTNLISSCNLFIFVVFNLTIKDNNNQNMLQELFERMTRSRGVTSKCFIKKCLFIVNADEKQEISEKTLNQAKADILSITTHKIDKNDFKDINICFYNALLYEQYLYKLMYYQSGEHIIQTEYRAYKHAKSKFFKGIFTDIMYGSFYKYLLKKLKDNIKNDIQTPFEENKVTPNEHIEKSISDALDYYMLKFKKKELYLISKYIIFGNQNIINSNLKFESKYDDFKGILYNCIKEAKSKEDKEINENLIKCFKIFDNVFEVDPETKFGKCRDAPIAKVVKPHMEKDLENMKTEIEKHLNSINKEFNENDVAKLLDESSDKISKLLEKEKSELSKNLEHENWKDIKKRFHDIIIKETRELKNNLLIHLKSQTRIIKKYYDECYNKLDEFYLKPCERKNQLYEDYISQFLGGSNKIETTIEDLITDVIKASNTATDWENNSFFSWVKMKLFDANYLNKTIEVIMKVIPKIKDFCDSLKKYSSSYKKEILDELQSSKDRVEAEMEERKKKENIEINLTNSKNEEEKQKWLEEKRRYELNLKEWEENCRRYRALRDEITEIRFTTL